MADRRDPTMPGGDQAVEHGCRCPIMDNGRGNIDLARDRGGWVIVTDCPLHGIGGSQPAPVPPQPGSRPLAAHSSHPPADQSSERPADTQARGAGDAESHGKQRWES